jgi:hypothetical protein
LCVSQAPWDFSPETLRRFAPGAYDPEQDVWELYYLPDDFSQARDLAGQHPDKLAELKELWWAEAERNRVLPLLGVIAGRNNGCSRPPPRPRPARTYRSCAVGCGGLALTLALTMRVAPVSLRLIRGGLSCPDP